VAEFRLETDRLIIREWHVSDRAPFAAMNADPEVMRYFLAVLSPEQSDAFVSRICTHFDQHGFGLFALEEKNGEPFIGFTGFQTVAVDCPVQGELEIGWRLASSCWRHGLAFEAASACLRWICLKTDVERIVSMTAEINTPSRGLMEKLGLTHRPELDFAHPRIPPTHPLSRHVIYAAERPAMD
jgi:RimJ/RimL family protein N-acetyltransferase